MGPTPGRSAARERHDRRDRAALLHTRGRHGCPTRADSTGPARPLGSRAAPPGNGATRRSAAAPPLGRGPPGAVPPHRGMGRHGRPSRAAPRREGRHGRPRPPGQCGRSGPCRLTGMRRHGCPRSRRPQVGERRGHSGRVALLPPTRATRLSKPSRPMRTTRRSGAAPAPPGWGGHGGLGAAPSGAADPEPRRGNGRAVHGRSTLAGQHGQPGPCRRVRAARQSQGHTTQRGGPADREPCPPDGTGRHGSLTVTPPNEVTQPTGSRAAPTGTGRHGSLTATPPKRGNAAGQEPCRPARGQGGTAVSRPHHPNVVMQPVRSRAAPHGDRAARQSHGHTTQTW